MAGTMKTSKALWLGILDGLAPDLKEGPRMARYFTRRTVLPLSRLEDDIEDLQNDGVIAASESIRVR
jgi:hypothetical protein